MYSHVLIGVDLDHEELVSGKIELARRLLADGGKITLFTVLEDVPGFVAEFVDMKGDNHLTVKVRDKLTELAGGDPAIGVAIGKGKAGVQIPFYAEEQGVDLIVVGSHHPTATDYFLGSTASRIARRADCAVLIVR